MNALEKSMFLLRHPGELLERVSVFFEGHVVTGRSRRASYRPREANLENRELFEAFPWDCRPYLTEEAVIEIEKSVCHGMAAAVSHAPFCVSCNGDTVLARLCYAIARAKRPKVILETGVCYGVTSAFLLKAVSVNGAGELHSIDLPPLGKHPDAFVGMLVPQELRHRWALHRGTSRRLMPQLLPKLAPLDMFVHDSLHTYRNMRDEFALAWSALGPGGVLVSDDIEGNSAFLELAKLPDVDASVVLKEAEKNSLVGIASKKV
jgi:predicted O-methyltransferase YrrM